MVRMVANYTNQKVYMQITLNKRLTVMADSGIRSDVASKSEALLNLSAGSLCACSGKLSARAC